MNKLLSFTFILILSLEISTIKAQTSKIDFCYDAAGNRISRKFSLHLVYNKKSEVTGINNDTLDNISVSVFPNPTSGFLNIKMEKINPDLDKVNIEIFDYNGRRIIQKQVEVSSTDIDLSELTVGIYLMKLSAGKKSQQWEIIKE